MKGFKVFGLSLPLALAILNLNNSVYAGDDVPSPPFPSAGTEISSPGALVGASSPAIGAVSVGANPPAIAAASGGATSSAIDTASESVRDTILIDSLRGPPRRESYEPGSSPFVNPPPYSEDEHGKKNINFKLFLFLKFLITQEKTDSPFCSFSFIYMYGLKFGSSVFFENSY